MKKKKRKKATKIENLKYILDRMYSCRDLEISNLWQRSVFLGTFLILCFTGYGALLNTILEKNDKEYDYFLQYHFTCSLLAILSIVFSILWIQMAKGSKAWYEIYEGHINKLQEELEKEDDTKIIAEFGMGKYNDIKMNNSLFSNKAGGYSPSKINIVIGQISLIVWVLILTTHTGLFWANYIKISFDKDILSSIFLIILIVFVWFIICLFNTTEAKIVSKNLNKKKNRCFIFQSKFFKQVRSSFLNNE